MSFSFSARVKYNLTFGIALNACCQDHCQYIASIFRKRFNFFFRGKRPKLVGFQYILLFLEAL